MWIVLVGLWKIRVPHFSSLTPIQFCWNKWSYNTEKQHQGRIYPRNISDLYNLPWILWKSIAVQHMHCVLLCTQWAVIYTILEVFSSLSLLCIRFTLKCRLFSANLICLRLMALIFSLENQGCYTVSNPPSKAELGCWQLLQNFKSCQTEINAFIKKSFYSSLG